ncbi:MAG: hypothetical protein GX635_04515 [Synergistaceae bacterium]|nr:hypothetical protein [Synergistaceae bacterium]
MGKNHRTKDALLRGYDKRRSGAVHRAHGANRTGRSRMFIGYFASVEIDGEPVTGADSSGIVFALRNCAEKLRARGVVLDAPALSERFYESGLSENSGWGYMRDGHDEPVHYIDRTKKYTRPPRYDSKS